MVKKIIFDTDLGDDCDDVMALDLLLSADRAGECSLLGVTSCYPFKEAVGAIWAVCNQHNRPDMPIGHFIPGLTGKTDVYAKAVADAFPQDSVTYDTTLPSPKLLRKLLAENDKVTLLFTGFFTNLAALLQTEGDEYSPLSGVELVREKVTEIAIMAGNFSHQTCVFPVTRELRQVNDRGQVYPIPENNIFWDVPAVRISLEKCPVPIVFLPFETGAGIISGKPMRDVGDGKTPDSLAFTVHGSLNGRCSWDPATALYAVYGAAPWFYQSAPGTVTVDEDKVTNFTPNKNGLHTFLVAAKSNEEIGAELDRLVMRLFD